MDVILSSVLAIALIAIDLYIWIIIIGAILSWLVAFNVVNRTNRLVYTIGDMTYRLTEPAIRPIRRFMPNLNGIDLAPLVLIFALLLLESIIRGFLFKYGVAG